MRRLICILLTVVIAVAVAIIVGRLIFPLPDISARQPSLALAAADTQLSVAVAGMNGLHRGKSGVLPLRDGNDALAGRLALAATAQRSIDAQYYIWHDDTSGRLLLKALYDASQRGVRVRLLVDDNGVPGLDATLAALDALPDFEVRLFNPSTIRRPKLAGYAIDFFRMNRRMHNKSFTVDGAASIIGGRNIGDEYFAVGDDQFYLDLDVLAVGKAVTEVSASFDDYWNSLSVYEAGSIIDPAAADLAGFLAGLDEAIARPAATALIEPMRTAVAAAINGQTPLEWTDVQLVVDDPSKGLGNATRDQLMITRLGKIIGDVRHNLQLVSAYFIPGDAGTDYLTGLAATGVDVQVLTNALATTDVLPVHAGYAKYRKRLLEGGVDLYELKPLPGRPTGEAELGLVGSSGASLHAKTFAVDGDRVFIGSFNFDPRSALLNCEMGFLIASPTLAKAMSDTLAQSAPAGSYHVTLDSRGELQWSEAGPDGTQVYEDEPGSNLGKRIALSVIGWLPVEWML